ncbi:MAG: GFA family protein [Bdellovibrionales bacterium]|nr:GFA family protein [Bdellovibrionales bacterium]
MKVKGHCLCEKVEFSISVESKRFDACHCSMCLRWGGGPALTVEAENGVDFADEAFVKVYSSSQWAERGFCSHCGTHLFYRLKEGNFWNVPLGVLEDRNSFEFSTQIFVDHKLGNYDFANKTKMMTEEDVLKAFGAET